MGSRIPESAINGGILQRLFGRRGTAADQTREAVGIAITSGKGGTGKSFVATNLAVALSRTGRRVAIVDCDFGLGNAHLLLGVNPKLTLQHVLDQDLPIEETLVPTPYGPHLVPAGSGISRLADLSENDLFALAKGLTRLATRFDVLILDTAAGISPQCLLTLLLTRYVVLVTNPEIAALTDAYALIKCLSRQPAAPRVSAIINRVPKLGMGRITFDKLQNVSQRFSSFSIDYLGEVPDDPAVTQRRLGQPPLISSHPDCDAARCVDRIMHRMTAAMGDLRQVELPERETLLQRFRTRAAR